MVTQYDEKGKIFTQVVTKRPVPVILQTASHLVRGIVHVKQDMRVKDELNGTERFVAVTDAVVYNSMNEELYRSSFLVVNKDQIVWIIPDEDASPLRDAPLR